MSRRSPTRRALAALAAVGFLACAAVQLNDPDPWRWVVAYGLASGICAGWVGGRTWSRAAAALSSVACAWAVLLAVQWHGGGGPVTDELGREVGGLMLVTLVMAAVWAPSLARRLRGETNRER